jgi:hypothetical protein
MTRGTGTRSAGVSPAGPEASRLRAYRECMVPRPRGGEAAALLMRPGRNRVATPKNRGRHSQTHYTAGVDGAGVCAGGVVTGGVFDAGGFGLRLLFGSVAAMMSMCGWRTRPPSPPSCLPTR